MLLLPKNQPQRIPINHQQELIKRHQHPHKHPHQHLHQQQLTQRLPIKQHQLPSTNATAGGSNQTAPAPSTNATAGGSNQTAPAIDLTTSDIEPVRDSLNSAREGLQGNDTLAALESINDADGALFALIIEEGTGPVSDQLKTLGDNIDTTRESVRSIDNAKALEDLNAADSQLLVITEMLPAEESEEESEEEEE